MYLHTYLLRIYVLACFLACLLTYLLPYLPLLTTTYCQKSIPAGATNSNRRRGDGNGYGAKIWALCPERVVAAASGTTGSADDSEADSSCNTILAQDSKVLTCMMDPGDQGDGLQFEGIGKKCSVRASSSSGKVSVHAVCQTD